MKWWGVLRVPKAGWNGQVGMYNDPGANDDVASALLCRVGPDRCATKEWATVAAQYYKLHGAYRDEYEYVILEVED